MCSANARPSTVHPHARGEHLEWAFFTTDLVGSSPRPWGTHRHRPASAGRPRFIPTPVGNTSRPGGKRGASSVHPHARGEHARCLTLRFWRYGSSPRPWGTLLGVARLRGVPRFIPTPVGNTPHRAGKGWTAPVHPHARGEHIVSVRVSVPGSGSSPRPWGTLDRLGGGHGSPRFIPTPVGNTRRPGDSATPRAVHPHARGEHRHVVGHQGLDAGSSPRPWGTHPGQRDRRGRGRFIPTPVGNTVHQAIP